MNANLFESLRRFADEAPERAALIHRGATLDYGDFRVRVGRRALDLVSRRLRDASRRGGAGAASGMGRLHAGHLAAV